MAEHAGAIIFGGPMSANDADDFVRREIDWIAVPLKESKPFLGICLGAQMLARHLGAAVYPHADGHAEIGYYPIRPTEHRPHGLRSLARAGLSVAPRGLRSAGRRGAAGGRRHVSRCRRFAIGSGYALQFHPDVTHATICRWTTRGHERTLLPDAKPRAAHFADRAVYDPAGRAWLAAFLNHWLGA